jgi:hypothetical protein
MFIELTLGSFNNLELLNSDIKALENEEYTEFRVIDFKVFNNNSHVEYYSPSDKKFMDKPTDYTPLRYQMSGLY